MKDNLFTRNDTILGICEALGEDFGFNPLWLRLAFVVPIFWFPVQMVMAYLGLGLAVLLSRTIFPKPKSAPADVTALPKSQPQDENALAEAA